MSKVDNNHYLAAPTLHFLGGLEIAAVVVYVASVMVISTIRWISAEKRLCLAYT